MNAGHRQTTVRPRWRFPRSVWRGERWMLIDSVSGLLPAWRSIAFCSGPVSNFRPKPGIYPPGDGRYLSRHKAPTCLYSAPVVFLANYPAQTGFVLISMGENGRLQDWRGAGPNNQVKYYFASWLRISFECDSKLHEVPLLFPLNFPVFTLLLKKSQLCGHPTPILISLLITNCKQ